MPSTLNPRFAASVATCLNRIVNTLTIVSALELRHEAFAESVLLNRQADRPQGGH